MSRFSRPVVIALLFFVVYSVLASSQKVLSGQDLLRVVRERQGSSRKLAYANRLTMPSTVQNGDKAKVELKSSDKKLPLKTKYFDAQAALMLDIKDKPAGFSVQEPSHRIDVFSALTPETPFERAIEIFRNSVKPPLNIVVRWRDLEENADIYRYTPINMSGISGVRLSTVLKVLLESVSGDVKLDYVVDNGVIIIATEQSLPKKLQTRVYNVTGILSQPADYRSKLSTGRRDTMGGGFQSYGR